MADVYASAVGTTVLQIKDVPSRPEEYDGVICLSDPRLPEAEIREALEEFGPINSIDSGMRFGFKLTRVYFSTHEAALRAKGEAARLTHVAGHIDTRYNERSYNGRTGEVGREDDNGRGW